MTFLKAFREFVESTAGAMLLLAFAWIFSSFFVLAIVFFVPTSNPLAHDVFMLFSNSLVGFAAGFLTAVKIRSGQQLPEGSVTSSTISSTAITSSTTSAVPVPPEGTGFPPPPPPPPPPPTI